VKMMRGMLLALVPASPEAGEAILRARVNIAMECFRCALRGEPTHLFPLAKYDLI
jgi:hypothetical protein